MPAALMYSAMDSAALGQPRWAGRVVQHTGRFLNFCRTVKKVGPKLFFIVFAPLQVAQMELLHTLELGHSLCRGHQPGGNSVH
jgi:hypothetical protein